VRIVTWNCNGAFRHKFERIAALGADVAVIQECEDPALSSAAYRDWAGAYAWAGSTPSKGVGVFVKPGLRVKPLGWEDHGFRQFLPVRIGRMTMLAVWTRQAAASNMSYIGQFWHIGSTTRPGSAEARSYAGTSTATASGTGRAAPGTIANASRCWGRPGSGASITRRAARRARETRPTFYLHRNLEKPYHLDYIFAHRRALPPAWRGLSVGDPREWLDASDHMPVIAEF
jgi:hypothetical protein